MSRVIAVRGVPTAHVLITAPSRVDVSASGRTLKGGYKVWPIATGVAKTELYGWLGLRPPTAEALEAGETYPPGYCHFPEYGEEFFRQLTAEQLVPHKTTKGFVVFSWELIPNRENHALDARVYARSAAAVVGLDRFRESDWAALERALGLDRVVDPVDPEDPPPPATPAPAAAASAPMKPRWIQSPRRGWLKGNR
jgi:phage terminase large subunit GpA-like protein